MGGSKLSAHKASRGDNDYASKTQKIKRDKTTEGEDTYTLSHGKGRSRAMFESNGLTVVALAAMASQWMWTGSNVR